jgi:hypothetical protein
MSHGLILGKSVNEDQRLEVPSLDVEQEEVAARVRMYFVSFQIRKGKDSNTCAFSWDL